MWVRPSSFLYFNNDKKLKIRENRQCFHTTVKNMYFWAFFSGILSHWFSKHKIADNVVWKLTSSLSSKQKGKNKMNRIIDHNLTELIQQFSFLNWRDVSTAVFLSSKLFSLWCGWEWHVLHDWNGMSVIDDVTP